MAIRYRDYLSRTIFLPCQLSADVFVSVPDIESLGWSCNSTALEVVADLTGRTCLSGQLADASSIRIILLPDFNGSTGKVHSRNDHSVGL